MRYYQFVLGTSSMKIKEMTKVKLRDYAYDSTLEAVNAFMYKNIKKGVTFFIYREDENACPAAFAYDEASMTLPQTLDYIMGMLKENFCIDKFVEGPRDVTTADFYEVYLEGRRRGYVQVGSCFLDSCHLWIRKTYENDPEAFRYSFSEEIIPLKPKAGYAIYDESLRKELANIKSCKKSSGRQEMLVQYLISGRGHEAEADMVRTLATGLLKAGRITSRRIGYIFDMRPDIYRGQNNLEEIIENNLGGIVVLDLTEKLGNKPTEYQMACRYLEKVFKRYRDRCQFIFTYHMDQPGFAYYLLPMITEYTTVVALQEGKGDRKDAKKYMKCLIEGSGYPEFADATEEFMDLFPGEEFTQTDVLRSYERYGAWAANRRMSGGYSFDTGKGLQLVRDRGKTPYARLRAMVGLKQVKKQIDRIIARNLVEKARKKWMKDTADGGTMHMIFSGNPGTAKTTVARLFSEIAREKGIVDSGAFVERGGVDLDGTIPATISEAFLAAKGGVLFIDEAYAIQSSSSVTTLIREMENHRDDVIVIFAGYNDRMRHFLELNEGLKSRIPYWVDFPDYNTGELTEIFRSMVKDRGLVADEDAIKKSEYIFDRIRHMDNFGNGRYVRNLLDKGLENQALRLVNSGRNTEELGREELVRIVKEDIEPMDAGLQDRRPEGLAAKELEEMIGLNRVKEVLRKAIANYKWNRKCMARGLEQNRASFHMVFTGNPGTAKTTVARLLAEILRDENILTTGTFVEAGRADLVGPFVASTAPLIRKKFREARGGILFIDEAYSLSDDQLNGFGDEAITAIVQEMENHREDVIVIFAGYPEPMKEFLDRNPGMRSRIAFHVEFEDYTTDELCDITRLLLSRSGMKITPLAMEKLRRSYEAVRGQENFGNGRFVRKLLEEAKMNLAERLLIPGEEEPTDEEMLTLEEKDIPETSVQESSGKGKIGFVVD